MWLERPDVDEYLRIVDDLADVQDELNRLEYQYSKAVATNVRTAIGRGAKTRELDTVKVLGNNEEEKLRLDALQEQIFDKKKRTRVLWGKIEAWKAYKELYRTDSYNNHGIHNAGFGDEE